MAVGLNKGHKVTNNMSKPRHSHRHGRLTKYTKCVRDIIQEGGMMPLTLLFGQASEEVGGFLMSLDFSSIEKGIK
eukprot:bmy_04320T0